MDIIGKTIAAVTTRQLVAKDTYGEYIDWSETTLHFTDGTTQVFAIDEGEVFDDTKREPADCVCGDLIIEEDGEWIHPFGYNVGEHDAQPQDVAA